MEKGKIEVNESAGIKTSDVVKEMVSAVGDKVDMGTAKCDSWRMDHPNCHGCPSELGCCKTARLMGIILTPLVYHPKDYQDFQKMNDRIGDLIEKVIKAKTMKELEKLEKIPAH